MNGSATTNDETNEDDLDEESFTDESDDVDSLQNGENVALLNESNGTGQRHYQTGTPNHNVNIQYEQGRERERNKELNLIKSKQGNAILFISMNRVHCNGNVCGNHNNGDHTQVDLT